MSVLALKLVLAPILIGAASLVTRRWGPSIGGWLVALPLTSGPVLFLLALEHGPAFAASAALGSLAGLAAIAGFSLAYAASAGLGPAAGFAAGVVAFVAVGVASLPVLAAPPPVVLALVLTVVAVALWSLPDERAGVVSFAHPRWDIPARMAVAGVLVFGLTTVAPLLGPHPSGIIATFPVYVSVMVTFTQQRAGVPSAIDLLRGLLVGLFGTSAFYVAVRFGVEPLGVVPAFVVATLAALAIQAAAFGAVRPTATASAA